MTTTNDNIRAFEAITERDLHAYIDGQLRESRRRKVEAYLEQNPEVAQEVEDYLRYNKLLRAAYSDIEEEPVPQRLMWMINRPIRNIWPDVARYAAVILLCIGSAGAGWMASPKNQTQTQEYASITSPNNRFLTQVVMNSGANGQDFPFENISAVTDRPIDPINWLTQKVALEMQAPNLSQAGYNLESRNLLSVGSEEFVELTYRNQDEESIKLYMKTRWDKEPQSIDFMHYEGQSIAHWEEGPLAYALTGPLDQGQSAHIADLIRTTMSKTTDSATPEPLQLQSVQINPMLPNEAPRPIYVLPAQTGGSDSMGIVDETTTPQQLITENIDNHELKP